MQKKIFNLCLRAIVYMEDGLFHAHCLEMDLVAVGDSEKASLKELQEMIESHISFAVFKGDDDLLLFPAEKIYFDRWEKANQLKIQSKLFPNVKSEDKAININGKAVIIHIEDHDLAKMKQPQRFSPLKEMAFA